MRLFTITLLLIVLLATTSYGQSIHSSNVETVTSAYWTLLGRAPDAPGLAFWVYEMDRKAKDKAEIDFAFKVSTEYQGSPTHPTDCVADYTRDSGFEAVRHNTPQELVAFLGQFRGRGLVGTLLDPGTGFMGNTITVGTVTCQYVLWYDFAARDIHDSLQLISELPNSKQIEVTYDPVSGLAYSIKIVE